LQMNLDREGPVSGFRIDLSKGSGVEIHVWIIENGMVEHVLSIHAESQVHGLPDPDALLHICIEGPEPWSIDCADAERTAPSRLRIPQRNVPIRICECGDCAPRLEIRCNAGARRIRDPLILLFKKVSECIA